MNATVAALASHGPVPTGFSSAVLVSGSLAVLTLALSTVWLLSKADDWAKLPGPKPASFILGHLPQDMCQQYGGMFRVRLLHQKVVVLSDPLLVQAVISREAYDLPKAHAVYGILDVLTGPKGRPSFFTTRSIDEWRLVRKATAPAFSPANIRKAFPTLMKVTTELLDVLAARVAGGRDVVQVTEAAMRVTLDVIGITGYGYDFGARKYSYCELFEVIPPVLGELTLQTTNPLRMLAMRSLPFLPEARAVQQRVRACHKWWRTLVDSIRRTDLQAAAAQDDTTLRVCLARLPLSDEELIPHVAAYLIAGFETTAHSIAWSLYEIASNPAVQRRMEAELAAAGLLGSTARPLEFADLAALPFLNCVIKEVMRLHPVASNGTLRQADRNVNLGGYRLSRGTIIWIPLISLLTSQHNWERAEEFWPQRWEAEHKPAADDGSSGPTPQGNAANPAKTYLPFSDGPRDCIGQNLAKMEAQAVLAAMVGRFQLAVAPEMGTREDVRKDEVMKLTLQCSKGIRLRLTPRP